MPTCPLLSNLIRRCPGPCLAALWVLATAGCSLAPSYQRPALPVPSAQGLAPATAPAQPSPSVLSGDEQALVDDLAPGSDLAARMRLALAFNRDLRVAVLRVQEARSSLGIVQADRVPTLAAGVERDRQRFNDPLIDERYKQDLAVASLGVSGYELDFFGRLKSLSDAARHDYLATAYGQQAARSALVVEVARTYLAQQLAAVQVASARRIDDAQRQLLQRAMDLQREGAASLDDVSLQQIEQLRAQQRLQDAISSETQAAQAMFYLTGYAQALAPVASGLSASTASPAGLVDLPSTRLLERFDVRQREETLQAANANIGAARAAFFPSIKLTTGLGIASPSLGSLFSQGSGAWLFTPQLNVPLFDGGRNQANLDLAWTRKDIAVAEYEATLQAAFRQFADVLAQRQQVLARVRSESALQDLASARVRRQALELDAGGTDRSVIQAALMRTASVDLALGKARYDLLLNRLDLYRALCGADASPPPLLADPGVSP